MKRLAIITTHPIQYNAPLFKQLSEEAVSFTVKVFYTWSQSKEKIFDKEFGHNIQWDLPLLQGYDYCFVTNTSADPGSHHFKGIINPSLNKEIEEWNANAILIYGWSFESHLKAIRYFHKKIPVLFRGDSTLIDEPSGFSVKKLVRRLFLRWIYSHADFALYVGSANKTYFLEHGLQPEQLLFAPHAIDNNRFSINEGDTEQRAKRWRKELGIGDDICVFLFAGKLSKKKDPELLIKAFLAIGKPQIRLIIIGNGELESELKEKYSSFADITFIDFQNQTVMPVVYGLAEIFVLPSKGLGETWGLAVNEAMACERAVIVSDKCGCSADLVVEGSNGYIFSAGDMEDLKRCMQQSLHNYKELGRHSKQIIDNWTYSKTILQLEALFEKRLFK